MPITVEERFQSRRGGTSDFAYEERDFTVRGSDVPVDIDAAVLAHVDAPATIVGTDGTLYRVGIRNRDQHGKELWVATVSYESSEFELAVGQKRHRWTTTGGTHHILHARSHVTTYNGSGTVAADANHDGQLGWDGRAINGADVVTPVFSFDVDIALSSITGVAATVLSLTGKLNNATFYGFAAGEVLYLGATRSDRGNGIKDVTHSFAASPNRTSVSVGSITVSTVGGWDVVSIASTEAGVIEHVYIDKVYDLGNFSSLGIGVSE